MAKPKRFFDLEFKKKIVAEYLSGMRRTDDIASEHGLTRGHIYTWKTQLEELAKENKFNELQASGATPEQAKRIVELEEELGETQKKLAQLSLENDLLKKLHPNLQLQKSANGYAETKKILDRSKGRAK